MSGPRLRFAPSPTGLLHVGNARLALINWLFARQQKGWLLLRLDDTDTERSTAAYAEAAERDLAWLGLDWDASARQSDRLDHYRTAMDRLIAADRLYPCHETPQELDLLRRAAGAGGRPFVYRQRDATERERQRESGRPAHWRFRLEPGSLAWVDLVHGPLAFAAEDLSDPVLVRADGRPLYALSTVVDDIEFGITHVVRGDDHITNTALQIQLFRALGSDPPQFAHLPLLGDASGEKLSKRAGALSLAALREELGLEPQAVVSLLARLGTADPIEPLADAQSLVEGFDFTRISRSAARFDPEELRRLNARLVHALPHAAVAPRLTALGIEGGEAFWQAVRPNLGTVGEAAVWWRIVTEPLAPATLRDDTDRAVAVAALDTLPEEPWSGDTWGSWTTRIKAATGVKGRGLFQPLRLALTGQTHGPEMTLLLPFLGARRVRDRLEAALV